MKYSVIPRLGLRFAEVQRLRLPHILLYWVAASKPEALGMVFPLAKHVQIGGLNI